MGLVVDAARNVQQVVEPLADQLLRRVAGPAAEGGVGLEDAAVGPQREIAARRVLVEVFEVLRRATSVRHQTKARIAAITSSGALRLGQWPVAFRITSLLSGICRCTYSPTACGAMMSSLHCRISVGTVTLARSARLSEMKVTRANCLGDLRIGAAEAVGQFLAEFRPVGIAHDRRRHGRGPAHVVVGEEVEQLVDLRCGEAADIVAVVDVARRGADQDEALETCPAP